MTETAPPLPQLDRNISLQCSNLYRHLTFLPSRLPGGKIRDNGDALLINSGYPSDTFNKVTHLLLPPDGMPLVGEDETNEDYEEYGENSPSDVPLIFDLQKHLDDIEAFFGDLPFTWWLGPGTLPANLGDILEARGYIPLERETGMHLDLTKFEDSEPDEGGLEIRWVKNPEQLTDYATLMAANWMPPDPSVPAAYREAESALLMPGGFIHFAVGYHNNQPVCGVEYWRGPGRMVGVYGLVTLEAWRRRGFASRLLSTGLAHWKREGLTEATLQASADGLGLYEKLGFKPYGQWTEYGKG